MKLWSRYNKLFCIERFGYFLYNALSNLMLELDESHYLILKKISEGYELIPAESEKQFIDFLVNEGFLAGQEEENLRLLQLQYRRNAISFSTEYLGLTICPTLACNFSCDYCFEHSQNDVTVMNSKTIDALVSFIQKHQNTRFLSVSWYGGEPTLRFDVIKKLSSRFLELYPESYNASLVTNAYLLDQKIIEQLDELKITSVQITLDGRETIHDSRRVLKDGGGTYQKIMANIDALMNSSWEGKCLIRVNIDKKNQHEYAGFRNELLARFNGNKFSVYPGRVYDLICSDYSQKYGLCNYEWAQFNIRGYNDNGVLPHNGFYPSGNALNTCIATSHYGYVVGPSGELYKCWEDVGKESMIIGSIHDDEPISRPDLVAQYSIATDPFNDIECKDCSLLPICGGGCANKRLRSKIFREEGIEYCSPFKDCLLDYLEAYLDIWQTKEICDALLGEKNVFKEGKGYRLVQPERDIKTNNPLENLSDIE